MAKDKKTLYLANPYGFSLPAERDGPLVELVAVLQGLGAEVWEPFERNNQIDRLRPGPGIPDRAGRCARCQKSGRAVRRGQWLSAG